LTRPSMRRLPDPQGAGRGTKPPAAHRSYEVKEDNRHHGARRHNYKS
jgi:hypothetical protein